MINGKIISRLCITLVTVTVLTACSQKLALETSAESSENVAAETFQPSLPDALINSYYSGQDDPAFPYFQPTSIQRFLAMWVKEETGDITEPIWELESFSKVDMLDRDLKEIRPGEQVYGCTFSDGGERYGYVIIAYNRKDPSVSKYDLKETTPCRYDLRANAEEINAALAKAGIDTAAATASRVYLYDRENKRADQAVLFVDKNGDRYIGRYGDESFEIEKWKANGTV